MWYFWIDQHRNGKSSAPDDRRARIHVYTGESLGGGFHPLKTACGRDFVAKEANIVSNRAIKILRGRICKTCFQTVRAEEVAEIFAKAQ